MTILRPPAEARAAVLARVGIAGSDRFAFTDVDVDGGRVRLRYHLDGVGDLTEELAFDGLDVEAAGDRPAVTGALRLLHLTAGVSYLKALLPPTLEFPAWRPDPTAHRLLAALLTDGLGEFAWVNQLDLTGWFVLPEPGASPAVPAPPLEAGPLVPVGGGKDSIVTLEAVRPLAPTLFAVNPRGPIRRTLDAAGLPAVTVTRTLDPRLFDLNDRGAFNGHVPVTAIVSAVAVVVAAVAGHRAVVMSNEGSADEPTLVVDGRAVNHQWSKSSAFAALFTAALAVNVHPELTYTSFLRNASELAIARRFTSLPAYDRVFNSCNRAFHLRGATTEWCGRCPKCRFVFLVLAPFMPSSRLTAIFGRDLLDDPEQTEGFAELVGLRDHKPFECVGEIAESRAALACLAVREGWRDRAVVRALANEIEPGCDALETHLAPRPGPALPTDLQEAFDAAF